MSDDSVFTISTRILDDRPTARRMDFNDPETAVDRVLDLYYRPDSAYDGGGRSAASSVR